MAAASTASLEARTAQYEILCGRARLDEKFAPLAKIWPNEGENLTVEARSLRLFQKACAFLTPGTKIGIGSDSLNAMALIELLEGLDIEEVAKKVAQKAESLREKPNNSVKTPVTGPEVEMTLISN